MGKLPKSQRYIRKAFLALLKEKGFRNMTVTDIITRAELGRSTFYLFYTDKYALLEELESELIEGFITLMLKVREAGRADFLVRIAEGTHPVYIEYFRYIRENIFAFEAFFLNEADTYFTAKLSRAIAMTRNETSNMWRTAPPDQETAALTEYRDAVLSSIYVALFSTWIKRGMDFSEQKMGHMLTLLWNIDALFHV